MNDKIWHELVHYKYGDDYLILYIDRLKTSRKVTNILTLVFSASGVFSWTFWVFIPVITSGLIAGIQLFKLIENHIIPSEKDIEQVELLRNKYFDYWNKVEQLWNDYKQKRITEEIASKSFYKLRNEAKEIEELDTKLNTQKIKSLKKAADKITRDYLSQYHNS